MKSTAYVYNRRTMNAVAVIEGDSNLVLHWMNNEFQWQYDIEKYAVTTAPAFGFDNGLKGINKTAKRIILHGEV